MTTAETQANVFMVLQLQREKNMGHILMRKYTGWDSRQTPKVFLKPLCVYM